MDPAPCCAPLNLAWSPLKGVLSRAPDAAAGSWAEEGREPSVLCSTLVSFSDRGASGCSDLSPADTGDLRGLRITSKATALSNAPSYLGVCF